MSLSILLKAKICTGKKEEKFIYMNDISWFDDKPIDCYLNITHNLGNMASKVIISDNKYGKVTLYDILWRPYRLHQIGDDDKRQYDYMIPAYELIEPIKKGLEILKSDKKYFSKFNSPNGWGLYEHFVPFLEKYYNCIKDMPYLYVETSR